MPDTWCSEAICWARTVGIVTGYADDTFHPDAPMSREELAVVCRRFFHYMGYDATATQSAEAAVDQQNIQNYAVDAMDWAVSQKLIQGFSDGTIRPQDTATRAQLATVLMRFCGLIDYLEKQL